MVAVIVESSFIQQFTVDVACRVRMHNVTGLLAANYNQQCNTMSLQSSHYWSKWDKVSQTKQNPRVLLKFTGLVPFILKTRSIDTVSPTKSTNITWYNWISSAFFASGLSSWKQKIQDVVEPGVDGLKRLWLTPKLFDWWEDASQFFRWQRCGRFLTGIMTQLIWRKIPGWYRRISDPVGSSMKGQKSSP